MRTNPFERIRLHLTFEGEVQGVGFRFQARMAAERLGVTGWVENNLDGTVEMEAQGTAAEIERLIQEVSEARFVRVTHVWRSRVPLAEHEYYFTVKGY